MKKILLLASILCITKMTAGGMCCGESSTRAQAYVATGAFPETFPNSSLTAVSIELQKRFDLLGIPNTQDCDKTTQLIMKTMNDYVKATAAGKFTMVDKVLFNNITQSWLASVDYSTLFRQHGDQLAEFFQAGADKKAIPPLNDINYFMYTLSQHLLEQMNAGENVDLTIIAPTNIHDSLKAMSIITAAGNNFHDSRFVKMQAFPNMLLSYLQNRLTDMGQKNAEPIWNKYIAEKLFPLALPENVDESLEMVKVLLGQRQLSDGALGSDLLAAVYAESLKGITPTYNIEALSDDAITGVNTAEPSSLEDIRAVFAADINKAFQEKQTAKGYALLSRFYTLTKDISKITLTDDNAPYVTDLLNAQQNKTDAFIEIEAYFTQDKQTAENIIELNYMKILAFHLGSTGILNKWEQAELYNAFKTLRMITKTDVDAFMASSDGKTQEGLIFLQLGKDMEVKNDDWYTVFSNKVDLTSFLEQPQIQTLIDLAKNTENYKHVTSMIANSTEIDDLIMELEKVKKSIVKKANITTNWAQHTIRELVISATNGASNIEEFITNVSNQIHNVEVQNLIRNAFNALKNQERITHTLNAVKNLPEEIMENIRNLDLNNIIAQNLLNALKSIKISDPTSEIDIIK